MAMGDSPASVDDVVERLKSIGIHLVALDFDRTILQVHTGGVWTESLEDLCQHVRPQLRELIQAIVSHNNAYASDVRSHIHMAVVTFSGQISLIRGILTFLVGAEQAERIPIRGEDGSWREPYPNRGWWPEKKSRLIYDSGKQSHMLSAIIELEQRLGDDSNIQFTKASTLLIDDDEYNVENALQNGVRGVLLKPEQPECLYDDILAST